MRAEILDIHQRLNNTSIYVTHDQLEAMTMGTRIIIMKDGLVQQNGSPQEIYNNPVNKFVAGFIGSPAMNLIKCAIKADGDELLAINGEMKLAIPATSTKSLKPYVNREVVLGLRPEHLSDMAEESTGVDSPTFKGLVRLVKPLGSEQLIHLEINSQQSVARIDPKVSIRYGETVKFIADMDAAIFFDTKTEERIV
mgnify:FL=1|jgi:multiple sugar transport system ATP-binding protein